MDAGDSEQSPPRGLRGSIARLGASVLGLVRTRLELASVEFAEERDRVQQQLILLVAAMATFMPAEAKANVSARPIPLPAPVTTATLPRSCSIAAC